MATVGIYKGFSTKTYATNKTFTLLDVELVKRDLLNHIYTRKGERIMMANYGTVIPDLVFENITGTLIELIHRELETVFDADPRVQTLNIQVLPDADNNAIVVTAILRYVEFQIVDALEFSIESN